MVPSSRDWPSLSLANLTALLILSGLSGVPKKTFPSFRHIDIPVNESRMTETYSKCVTGVLLVRCNLLLQFMFFPDYLFKFLIIGNAGTGKSCLLHQFIENKCM